MHICRRCRVWCVRVVIGVCLHDHSPPVGGAGCVYTAVPQQVLTVRRYTTHYYSARHCALSVTRHYIHCLLLTQLSAPALSVYTGVRVGVSRVPSRKRASWWWCGYNNLRRSIIIITQETREQKTAHTV